MLRNWYFYVLPALRDHCSFDSVKIGAELPKLSQK